MDLSQKRARRILIYGLPIVSIFLIAATIRVVSLERNPITYRDGFGKFGDAVLYHSVAYNLYAGRGYSGTYSPDAWGLGEPAPADSFKPAISRAPLYPAFLAAIYTLFGNEEAMRDIKTWRVNWDRIRVIQSLMDASIVFAVFLLGSMLVEEKGFWVGLVGAGLYAVCPYNIYYTSALLSETLAAFVLTWTLAALVMAMKTGHKVLFVTAGVGLGLFLLARQEFILSPLFLSVLLIWLSPEKPWRRRLMPGLLFLAGVFMAVGPWTIRNAVVFDRLIPIASGAIGWSLLHGTFEGDSGWMGWEEYPDHIFSNPEENREIHLATKRLVKSLDTGGIEVGEFDEILKNKALSRIGETFPGVMLGWLKNTPRLWYFNYVQMYQDREPGPFFISSLFLLTIAAFIWSKPITRKRMLPALGLVLYLTAVLLPLHIEPRYSVGLMPALSAMAGAGALCLIAKIKSRC
jgi:4-amino-4-deoxy-L-arabinose transferase-like glycosyltransferase